MYRLIFVTLIMCMIGCTHVKGEDKTAKASSAPRQAICSETNGHPTHLRLTVELKNLDLKDWTLHKQFEMPYFKRKDDASFFRISREILEWRNDRIVLAEVMPMETTDAFMLYVTSFERSKDIKITSSGYVLLRLCQDTEMSVGDNKNSYSLKARLELVD